MGHVFSRIGTEYKLGICRYVSSNIKKKYSKIVFGPQIIFPVIVDVLKIAKKFPNKEIQNLI